MTRTQRNTAAGAAIGGVAGNLIGGTTGATLGGAALGGVIGSQIDRVIELQVDNEEIVKRMLARGRSDDNEETIRNRLAVFEAQTKPLIAYYEAQGKLRSIDGSGELDAIRARIEAALA